MDQLTNLLRNLSLRQKLSILGGALVVALLLWQGVHWNRENDLRPLFTNLDPQDAGTLVERLKAAQVPYKVGEQGTVLVPSARVAELRLEMAAAGLPRTGRIGFELFDKTNFGTTDFAEQVNYRRAVEGELERSIMAIAEVERARVHVTFAKQSLFLDHQEPAKASVMVKLRPGAQLQPQHLQGIAHLTASAVEGLSPDSVSVIDMAGKLLSRPRRSLEDGLPGATDAMIEYRQTLEREMLVKIRQTLDPLLGEEKYRAGVSLECDFTSGEQSEETFDPDSSVMVTSQKTEDASGSAGAGGIPGTASSLPRPAPRPTPSGGTSVSRRTESIAYQTSRVVKRTQIPRGSVKRISVAVLVDQGVRWEGNGTTARRVLDAPSPEKLKVVKDLLAGVVGFQEQRGDRILVETLPFEATLTSAPPNAAPSNAPTAKQPHDLPPWTKPLLEMAPMGVWAGAAGAALIVFGVGILWWLRRRGPRPEAAVRPGARALPGEDRERHFESKALAALEENAAERARLEEEVLNSLRLPPNTKKSEVLKKHIGEQARRDAAGTAQLVRTWLSEVEK